MTTIISAFIVLLLAVALGIQLNHDPGYVLIGVNHWTLETTLWFALLALLLFFIIMHGLLNLIAKLVSLPRRYHRWQNKKRLKRAQKRTRTGLIAFSEGNWETAQKNLVKALPDTDAPLLNYLTAAQAAHNLGNTTLRDNYLREAEQHIPDAKLAVELTQAQLQLTNQQWEQALETLSHLRQQAPHHPYVLKLLMHLYQDVKDWPQLLRLLPELRKNKIISEAEFERLEHDAYFHRISDLIRLNDTVLLEKTIQNLPKKLKYDPDLMTIYSQFLIKNNEKERAEKLLRQSLQKNFSPKIIDLYGKNVINDKQLQFAEGLLKKHPDSSYLLLSLARISMAQQLWGKARAYLEQSLALQPTAEAYAELGHLLEQFGDQAQACAAYRQGIALTHKG